MTYYNTTAQSGAVLQRYRLKAGTQQAQILEFFRANPAREFTPSEVRAAVFPDGKTPITSVRRSISNLTAAGALKRARGERTGPYGRPERLWHYGVAPVQERLL